MVNKLNKNVLAASFVYATLTIFGLYFILSSSSTRPSHLHIAYNIQDILSTDRIDAHRLQISDLSNGSTRADRSNGSESTSSLINCSLPEWETSFFEQAQAVLAQLKDDNSTAVLLEATSEYNLGNVAEYVVTSVCVPGTSLTEEQQRQLVESIKSVATLPKATRAPRPQTKKYYSSVPDDKKVFDLQCQTCALVSSSGRILGSKAGHEIDNHSCVIRMNDAPSHGFEEDVGSRTTVRAGSFVAVQIMNRTNYRFIFGSERGEYNLYWGIDHKSHRRIKAMLRTFVRKNGSHSEVYYMKVAGEQQQNQLFENMTSRNRADSKAWLSTGWFTFQLALDLCDKLDVYGMVPDDYCRKNNTKVKYHYYQRDNGPVECNVYNYVEKSKKNAHRFMTEKAIFAKWAVMYNVSFYHPTWNLSMAAKKKFSTPFMSRTIQKQVPQAKRIVRRRIVRKKPQS